MKFLKTDNRFTYIASGSLLGVTLSNTQSVPVGSIEIKHMYPMDFEEFLIANGIGKYVINVMKEKFQSRMELPEAIHNKIMNLFRRYLIVGGLPDAVNMFIKEHNVLEIRKIQENIHTLYKVDASKYERNHSKLKIQRIYDMIPSIMENKKKRVVVRDIEEKKGKRTTDYDDDFDYRISFGIVMEVKAISKPSYPLIENSGKNLLKLYINDVGLLTNIFYKKHQSFAGGSKQHQLGVSL